VKTINVRDVVARPEARVHFLEDFIGFGEVDRGAIRQSLLVLGPRLPAILDALYDHLLGYDETKRLFLGTDGPVDPAYIAQRKEHLTEWLLTVAASDEPNAFSNYIVKIARQHTRLSGDEKREVPPRYIVALTAFLQANFTTAIFEAIPDSPAEALRTSLAWSKLLMIQLELFLKVVAPFWPEWDEASVQRPGERTGPYARIPG
jgi:hypothetical protein